MVRKMFISLLFLLVACDNNFNISIKYQKVLIFKAISHQIYCYHLSWGIDGEAYYISSNRDVCEGFDSTKDLCFPYIKPHIFYKIVKDTLKLYSDYTPEIPSTFPIPIEINEIQPGEISTYEEQVAKGNYSKINFDSTLIAIPCERKPYTTPQNMKFKAIQ